MSASDYSKPNQYVPPEIGRNYSEGGVLFVARDPGGKEVQEGRPLIGPSGSLLTGGYIPGRGEHPGLMRKAGLRRSDVALANLVPIRPWNNDFYRHSWDDINQGMSELSSLMEDLKPGLIVAFGGKASFHLVKDWQHLTGQNEGGRSIKSAKKIMERRGYFWHPEDYNLEYDAPVLTTLHPASCLYTPVPNEVLMAGDMERLGKKMRGNLPKTEWPKIRRVRTAADLQPLYESEVVAFDIELTWGGDRFLCLAMYAENLRDENGDPYALVAYETGLGACRDWLASDVTKLAHNKQFDTYYLKHKMGYDIGGVVEDTQLAWHAANLELAGKPESGRESTRASRSMTRKSLSFLAAWDEVDLPYWKTAYGSGDHKAMGRLCAYDVYATRKVWPFRKKDLEDRDVVDQYELHRSMTDTLNKMQSRGMKIDEDLRQQRVSDLYTRSKKMERRATKSALDFLQENDITHDEEDDSEYWWYHDAQCECCNGGSKKSQHCDSCAGIEGSGSGGSILKDDLAEWARDNGHDVEGLTKGELEDLLPTCRECGGEGTVPDWDLNIMSSTQLPEILWTHLGVPKYTLKGGSPNAKEETIRRVAEWANDADYTKDLDLEDSDG